MNIIPVKINGNEYNLKGEENEEYLQKLARYIDKKIKDIMGNNAKLSIANASILTAINVCDEMFKSDAYARELCEEVNNLQKECEGLKEQSELLKKQINHIEAYNQELCEKIKIGQNDEKLKLKDEEIKKLTEELNLIKEKVNVEANKNSLLIKDRENISKEKQDYRYKALKLESEVQELKKKLENTQIELVKEKKLKNPLLKTNV